MLGIEFLSSFYQVFDVKRHQLALVHNIYTTSDMVQPPRVLHRDKMAVLLPGSFATLISLTFLAFH